MRVKKRGKSNLTFSYIFLALLVSVLTGCSGSSSSNDEPPPTNDTLNVSEEPGFFPIVPEIVTSEDTKMSLIETTDRSITLIYNSSVELYVATAPGKPEALPAGFVMAEPFEPIYSNGFQAAFIQQGGDETRWFAAMSASSEAAQIIWQVSDRPFSGTIENWETPLGLLQAGEVSAEQVEFKIDFSEFSDESSEGITLIDDSGFIQSNNENVNPQQKIFYVRAVAIDIDGDIIGGEPGKGLELLYGDRLPYTEDDRLQLNFALKSGEKAGQLIFSGEYQNTLINTDEIIYNQEIKERWFFQPNGFQENTDTLYLQVTKALPSSDHDDWRAPTGLVYELKLERGEEDFDNLSNEFFGIPIDLKDFSYLPPALFYIRAVALSNGPIAGTVRTRYSNTITLRYVFDETDFDYIPPPEVVKIKTDLPELKLVEYQPIRWEDPDWMYHYEVVRRPTYKEYYALTPTLAGSDPNKLVEGINVGDVIVLSPPVEGDSSWLSDAWDAVTGFFGSIKDFLAKISNWVSNAYEDIKSELVELVVSGLPLIPDNWREKLEEALKYAVDYGLITIGVPPSIPNFDELTNLGVDYLASQALERAGIPKNELTLDAVKQLSNGISEKVNSSATSGTTPNPMLWNFVRQYPRSLYRPAYVLVEISNPYGEPTPKGTLSTSSFVELTTADLSDPNKSTLVASFGGWRRFEVYLPVGGVPIPSLLPGQTIQVPVFYEEYIGHSYYWFSHIISYTDFSQIYNNLGDYTFHVNIEFELPPVQEIVDEQGLSDDYLYEHLSTGRSLSFKTHPAEAHLP